MAIMKPSKEWETYIKFTDKYINFNSVNKYTLSNFFLHPTRPLIQTNRILVNLKNISLLYKLKMRIKVYIFLLKTLFEIFKDTKEKILIDNKKKNL